MEGRVGKLEVDVGMLSQRMFEVEKWVPESRTFHRDMESFKARLLAQQDAIRDEQSARHRSNSTKLNIIATLIALGTLFVLFATLVVSVWVSRHADITPQKILKSEAPSETAEIIATQ